LVEGQQQITLSVTDDGHGFDPARGDGGSHFGLVSMQERAHALGGMLLIEQDTSRGTTVRLTVPLTSSEDGE
jgi:signal transduction histidine kinase